MGATGKPVNRALHAFDATGAHRERSAVNLYLPPEEIQEMLGTRW